ncbi:DUF4249 domain-containing protein [Candidatus Neomarinimicrobiota bacterium]
MLLLSNCDKSITIDLDSHESQLSVECILEPNRVPELFLGRTVGYFDTLTTNLDIFVADAFVTISGARRIDTLVVKNEFDHYLCRPRYLYRGSIPISPGREYNLIIVHDGKRYEAVTQMTVPAVQIDSISFIQEFSDIYGQHEGVVVSFTDIPGQRNYYRYRMDRVLSESQEDIVNCTEEPYQATEIGRSLFFDTNIDGASLTIVIEPVFKHEEGDTAYILLQTLDKTTAQYYDDMDNQKESKENPFIEPIFINSNIGGAFGIFGASNFSTPIEFIYPEEEDG